MGSGTSRSTEVCFCYFFVCFDTARSFFVSSSAVGLECTRNSRRGLGCFFQFVPKENIRRSMGKMWKPEDEFSRNQF